MIPLCNITLPHGYLLPKFTTRSRDMQQEEPDIFRFDNRSIQQIWTDCSKAIIRDTTPISDRYITSLQLIARNINLLTCVESRHCIFKRQFIREVLKSNEVSYCTLAKYFVAR